MNINELLAEQLEGLRVMTLETFKEFSASERLFQPRPDLNHPLWLLGHIATSEDHLILDWCAGRPQLPEEFNKLFAIRSRLLAAPSGYPPAEDILRRLSEVLRAALGYVRDLLPEELDAPSLGLARLPEAAWRRFATKGKCLLGHMAHEAGHQGQMAYLRRMLGKPARV